jgi:hypothetical protein
MATLAELTAMLTQINIDIAAAQKSQSYGINGKTLTRGNLKHLYEERSRIECAISRMNQNSCSRVPEYQNRDE